MSQTQCLVRKELSYRGKGSMDGDRLLDIDEAAERLSTSKDWLYRHWRKLPFAVSLSPRQLRFSSQGIDEYIEQRKNGDREHQ